MPTARNPLQRWKYVLARELKDLPRSEQTTWHLRHLTARQECESYDDLDTDPKTGRLIRRNLGSSWYRTLKAGLEGVENFRDATGAEIKFESDAAGQATDAFILKIPMDDRTELAIAIQNEIAWEPDAVGKSGPPST